MALSGLVNNNAPSRDGGAYLKNKKQMIKITKEIREDKDYPSTIYVTRKAYLFGILLFKSHKTYLLSYDDYRIL